MKHCDLSALAVGVVVTGIVTFNGYFRLKKPDLQEDFSRGEVIEAYQNCFCEYADWNRDGRVSNEEREFFERQIIDRNGAYLPNKGEIPVYLGGEEVPYHIFMGWINEYLESKKLGG